ncbi:MAG: hypothetical protein ACSLE6_02935 [Mycobacterium sp.]
MRKPHRATPTVGAAKRAMAGLFIAAGAVAMAAPAFAQPVEPVPVPVDPAVAQPAPGSAVATPVDPAAVNPALPVAGLAPTVPNTVPPPGSQGGVVSSLGDLWEAARTNNPDALNPTAGSYVGAPPGAGPAPMLPPGYISLTAPESTNLTPVEEAVGPPLPAGYYPLDGPPPPEYEDPLVPPAGEPVPATS